MISFLNYLKDNFSAPSSWIPLAMFAFLLMQAIGEILEIRGKVVPEFVKLRKYFDRKKKEREILAKMPDLITKVESVLDISDTLSAVKKTLDDVNQHYSKDNIKLRDKWIESVNNKLDASDQWMKKLDEKIDRNNADTLSLLIDSKRNTIIDFAAYVINESNPVTREQYARIFKIYEEYEKTIKDNGMTNGEVDIAIRIIVESYENHLRNGTFVEDVRGYSTGHNS